jgi:hypothetical protein
MELIIDITDNIKRVGKPSASRISELLTKGIGKTRMNYIFDLACEKVGVFNKVNTKAMEHGLINQKNGFDAFVSINSKILPFVNELIWYDKYIAINEMCGASPDAIAKDIVADIKCQYSIDNFIEQTIIIPKKYYAQIQMQMIANKCNSGYLVNYLTKPELYGDDWEEYPFDLNERIHFHLIKEDAEMQDNILKEVEAATPIIYLLSEKLISATKLNDAEFFYHQLLGKKKYIKLKDTSWDVQDRDIYLFNNTYYVISK